MYDRVLEQQDAQSLRILDNLADWLICRYLPNGLLTYVNRAYSDYFGKSPQELIGQHLLTLLPELDPEIASARMRELLQTDGITYDTQVVSADGSVRWQEWTDQALYNESGELIEVQSIGRDITSRKLTELSLQQLNSRLEQQVQAHALQLQQTLEFEALLRRITDRVRDSLDEHQILQTAVQELAIGLNLLCCDAALYDVEQKTTTIRYEHSQADFAAGIGTTLPLDSNPDLYQQTLRGWSMQCCFPQHSPDLVRPQAAQTTIFICPLIDDRSLLGDLWLFRPVGSWFTEPEVRLVEQVANQCAIALRQSRLYQAAQTQAKEFERLSHLKDDFLSTVSHELRTPMANIKMAAQMLDVALSNQNLALSHQQQISRYLKILKDECRRETSLINDLLDLSRLDSGDGTFVRVPIDLHIALSRIAAPFTERIHNQQQHLILDIAPNLPVLVTDLSYLERILNELLTNACKYTPAGEVISVQCRVIKREDVKGEDVKGEASGIQSEASGMESEVSQSPPHNPHPTPHTPHPTPSTPHPTPHTLYPTPHTPHPTPHTPHPLYPLLFKSPSAIQAWKFPLRNCLVSLTSSIASPATTPGNMGEPG